MPLHSLNTELNDRTLWYDGVSTVNPNKIVELLSTGMPVSGMCVDELTDEINQYNKLVDSDERITVKKNVQDLNFDWNIPQEYKELDVRSRVYQILEAQDRNQSEKSTYVHHARVDEELKLYEQLGLTDVLRVLIYVINTLQAHNIVWGVGRGSSVASYVLYLIGVHDIDSIKYELNITDFLRVNES